MTTALTILALLHLGHLVVYVAMFFRTGKNHREIVGFWQRSEARAIARDKADAEPRSMILTENDREQIAAIVIKNLAGGSR